MNRVILIGLGNIAPHHVAGLRETPNFELVGVCDIRKETAGAEIYSGLPFETDVATLIEQLKPDMAIVTTPPASHRSIAEKCLQYGIQVLLEKPIASTQADANFLLSDAVAPHITPIYHSICGPEVRWFKEHLLLQDVKRVEMSFSDPYSTAEGTIHASYRSLGGTWLDSAVNMLAPISLGADLRDMQVLEVKHAVDSISSLPYHTDLYARVNQTPVHLQIAWEKGINRKQTLIESDSHQYLLNHSRQAVFRDGELLFQDESMPRLTAQYKAFYSTYPHLTLPLDTSRLIYETLFKYS